MTEHRITAREPVIQKSGWIYEDGELVQEYRKDMHQPDIPDMYSYECSCGDEFDTWNEATEHLKP